MTEAILLTGGLVLFVIVMNMKSRLGELERAIGDLRKRLDDGGGAPAPRPSQAMAVAVEQIVVIAEPPPIIAPEPVKTDEAPLRGPMITELQKPADPPEPFVPPAPPPPPKPALPKKSPGEIFEQLVGGKLPIWVGGAALAFAGFYLVKLAIEAGLLNPAVRTLLATLFGFALIAAAELAGRWKRVDDERVAQALAGAGIATLYAAAYLASAVYGLITPVAAFALMAAVTALALGLSLRHGAPTAIMGLIGGFVTPLIAGAESDSVIPVLIYLGLLSAGLFALAIRRGWLWLAVLTAAGSFLWGVLLIAADADGETLAVGGFVMAFAFAAAAASPASSKDAKPLTRALLRAIPIGIGLLELAALIPRSGFGLEAWGLYLLLAGGGIWLALRDAKLTPLVIGALVLSLAALGGGVATTDKGILLFAAIGIGLLFGGAGRVFGRREGDGPLWAGIGALGLFVPFVLLHAFRLGLTSDAGWAGIAALLMLPPLHLAWRGRGGAAKQRPYDWSLQISAATAALFAIAALGDALPWEYVPAAIVLVALALAAAGRAIGDVGLLRQSLGFAALGAVFWAAQAYPPRDFARLFSDLPPIPVGEALRWLLLPGVLLGVLAWLHRGRRAELVVAGVAVALALSTVTALIPVDWRTLAVALAAVAIGEAAARGWLPRPLLPLALVGTLLWMLGRSLGVLEALGLSIAGEHILLPVLPGPMTAALSLLAPAPLVAFACWRASWLPAGLRAGIAGAAAAGFAVGLYVLAKQPFAIRAEADFVARGMLERTIFTQALFAAGALLLWRKGSREAWRIAAYVLSGVALARLLWFDLLVLNPGLVTQHVGALPIANLVTAQFGLGALWIALLRANAGAKARLPLLAALTIVLLAGALLVTRQLFQGPLLVDGQIGRTEFYGYSVAGLVTALGLLIWGWRGGDGAMRVAGLGLLTLIVFKVFLVDAAALEGVLRVLSFLGLGFALIAIGWAYGRFLGRGKTAEAPAEA